MLEIKNVTKSYGKKVAVKEFSMRFEKGIYGLLGPNGAGKSTIMNTMARLIKKNAGEILLDDVRIEELGDEYFKRFSYLPQKFGLYEEFKAVDNINYFGMLKGLDKKQIEEVSDYYLDIFNLKDVKNKKVKSYSGGMRQRLGIIIALLNKPDVLVLDEPTVGLDPKERIKFREEIKKLSKDIIVIISTHIVSDVEESADTIIIMKEGQIVDFGDKEHILNSVSEKGKECSKLEEAYMYYFD
ncbi:MAG: ATP-binding cassette domain-containing protein [Lachnospiraceae bacterium]|nr:ATP-binding cassette domain-containing protein [Lachnospiraceae bacterium]